MISPLSKILLLTTLLISISGTTQVVFNETFGEVTGAIDGTDDAGGVYWETNCPTCLDAGDYFKVNGGALEGQDSNGPATWTTNPIDISDCDFIEIQFDLAEEGDLEACGTGCNSVDFVQFEYNIDGAGWTNPADAYYCDGTCASVMVIQSDDIPDGARLYSTGCMEGGSEIQLRITIQAWAASERWLIDNVQVLCSDGPTIDAGLDQVICEGTEITLEADNPDDALISWDNDVEDGSPFTPGIGTIDYTVTATDGVCTSSDIVSIEVIAPVSVAVSPAGPYSETSGIHIMDASPDDGTWSADCGACIDAVTGAFDPAVAGVGIWEICYDAGVAPCDDHACIEVEVTEDCLITAEKTATEPTCFGDSDGTVSITVEGTTGFITYVITNESDEVVNIGNDNSAYDLVSGWYYFTVTDEFPCVYLDSIFLADPAELEIELTVNNPMCYADLTGASVVDTVLFYGGDYESIFYTWVPNPSGVDGIGITSLDELEEGVYTVTVTDENGCSAVENFEIIRPVELLISALSVTNVSCFGEADGSVVVEGSGGTSPYSFSKDGIAYSPSGIFNLLSPGFYTFHLKDNNGCEVDSTIEITSPTEITVDENVTAETCTGNCDGTIELVAITGEAPFTFSIDGCASFFGSGEFSDLCAADYSICVEDATGCHYTNTVTIVEGMPLMDGSFLPHAPICLNDAPFPIAVVDAGLIAGDGVIDGVFYPALAGVGDHILSNTFVGECSSDATTVYTVNAIPAVAFTADKTTGCTPVEIVFVNTGDAGVSCEWNFGDGTSSEECGVTSNVYNTAGLFDVRLNLKDENGCINSAIYADYIEVVESPIADFSYNPNPVNTLNTTVHFIDESVNAVTWDWDFAGLGTAYSENPAFVFPEIIGDFAIELVVTNTLGCSDSIEKVISISEAYSVYIPNAFTPDGNQLNGVFKPYFNGIDIYNYQLTIYNRWGEMVFQSYNLANGWDGTYNNELAEEGVYVYHIITSEINSDKKLEYHGHVTLLR